MACAAEMYLALGLGNFGAFVRRSWPPRSFTSLPPEHQPASHERILFRFPQRSTFFPSAEFYNFQSRLIPCLFRSWKARRLTGRFTVPSPPPPTVTFAGRPALDLLANPNRSHLFQFSPKSLITPSLKTFLKARDHGAVIRAPRSANGERWR